MTRPRGQSAAVERLKGAMTIRIDGFSVWETGLAVFHKAPNANERVCLIRTWISSSFPPEYLMRYAEFRMNWRVQIGTDNSHS